jgi:hypothetical protein
MSDELMAPYAEFDHANRKPPPRPIDLSKLYITVVTGLLQSEHPVMRYHGQQLVKAYSIPGPMLGRAGYGN